MRNVLIRDIDGYKELSELKNLRFLDVSVDGGPFRLMTLNFVIRSLLQDEVQMQNLEFLDCTKTFVREQELREFVERHPSLKTVVAISTECDQSSIPTIDLINFSSIGSTVKCVKYAISNERDDLAEKCVHVISGKLSTSYEQLTDSEIRELLNALLYVLRETKDIIVKHWVIQYFAASDFFEPERFSSSFSLEIPKIVELIFESSENLESVMFPFYSHFFISSLLNRIVNFLELGRTLQDKFLNLIIEKTVRQFCVYSEADYIEILLRASRLMNLDQRTAMCNNTKVIEGLFDIAHKTYNWETSNQRIMELIVSLMKEASEETLKFLVSNSQIVENCIEQFMIISRLPEKESQKHLLHFLMVFSYVMSDEQLKKCYGGETVFKLMGVINTKGLRNPFEKTRAITFCSIISLLLAKNLTKHREYIKMKIKEFGNSWGQSNIPDCQKMSGKVLNAIITSRGSTDESICLCLILMSTFIHIEGYEASGCWNYMRTTLEGIRSNPNMTEYTREAANAVLYEMERIEN
ncbi:unnamed protein product [Caenorhabditis nigoni]